MSRLAGVDPGRSKCGLVLVDTESLQVLSGAVVICEQVLDRLSDWQVAGGLDGIVLGDGTGSAAWLPKLRSLAPVQQVNEYGTTLRARRRYWELWPPRGWQRLIPRGLLIPPEELDAIAALVMVEDSLGTPCRWSGAKQRLRSGPER
ncbi:MAG: resolvase [Synechococcus sp. BS301-5m-G54]|jgi:hypothetical protein|uniref:resolvase n=1 Tax=Synechococcales TaxID=1890424 RepID=UPI0004E05F87|nr:resolvase [Synechococcus sp. KORDI-49]MBL6739181.1 resolvase [Synechococcus sp. BS301-5m-G54]MBL6795328.1 resolvase [Synechococcus sp. BS307-5m-G34]RCL54684.1 MAG: resolvase [Synechococcus sp. MED-G70]HCX53824.1 resolvase [Synechococcus sp. UBA9887]AII46829.1 hypothetical protein KR49_10310 [Synechococcus sp. KORDI-49]|tara:strand:+ start:6052 stop:6492 length:441 start_codon:yes stop_codon:yes gene_type:complete